MGQANALSTLAGQCGTPGNLDGFQAGWSTLDTPSAVAVDMDGKVFFADKTGLRIIADGNVTTLMPGVRAGAMKVYENWQFAGRCEASYTEGVNTAKTAADDPNVMFQF